MKKYLLLILLCILVKNIKSQWIPYFLPYQGVAYSLNFYDINKGVSAGHTLGFFSARIFFTSNSGNNWILSSYPSEIRALPALQFIDSLLVYSGGAENLFSKGHNQYPTFYYKYPDFIKAYLYNIGIDGSPAEYKGVFLKSTNSGQNWQKVGNFDTTAGYIMDMKFFNSNSGFVIIDSGSIGNSRVLKTTNGGINWSTIYLEQFLRLVKIKFINQNTGFVCGDVSDTNLLVSLYGVLFKTTNGGINWSKMSFPYTLSISDLAFFNENTCLALGNGNIQNNGSSTSGTKLFRSTDGGNSWDSILFVIGVIPSIVETVKNTGVAFSVGYYYDTYFGIGKITTFKTSNFGLNWLINYLNNDVYITGLSLIDENNFYMSGGFSGQQAVIYRSTNGGTIFVNGSHTKTPEYYHLYQNFPNPFNFSTRIKFDCYISGFVRLNVIDLQGKVIATLINDIIPSGSYNILFEPSFLSTGIFFYTLEANGFKETKKMLFIK